MVVGTDVVRYCVCLSHHIIATWKYGVRARTGNWYPAGTPLVLVPGTYFRLFVPLFFAIIMMF